MARPLGHTLMADCQSKFTVTSPGLDRHFPREVPNYGNNICMEKSSKQHQQLN